MFEQNNNPINLSNISSSSGGSGLVDSATDKFKFPRKWFWIGIVISILNMLAGLVFGIALLIEREHRKEGIIITVLSAILLALVIIFLRSR